jgi:hypothetical protein
VDFAHIQDECTADFPKIGAIRISPEFDFAAPAAKTAGTAAFFAAWAWASGRVAG